MSKSSAARVSSLRRSAIQVTEGHTNHPRGVVFCEIGTHIAFSTASLESYFFAEWDAAAYDALLVAAAVEFADRTLRRSTTVWQRDFELRIPVHDVDRWNTPSVSRSLHEALSLLTGDRWRIDFTRRRKAVQPTRQGLLSISPGVDAVIPFSNGLDSCAVAGLMAHDLGDRLVRVRLGSVGRDGEALSRNRYPFTAVPYKVRPGVSSFVESTARSRGF